AYEYAIQALRYSAGVAVAMSMAPVLLLVIIILGRYMMRREDIAHSEDEEGMFWRALMVILWPVRMLIRGLVFVFWTINGLVESVAGSASRALSRGGTRTLLPHRTRRGIGTTVMYIAIGLILLFELLPFYFIFVTSF